MRLKPTYSFALRLHTRLSRRARRAAERRSPTTRNTHSAAGCSDWDSLATSSRPAASTSSSTSKAIRPGETPLEGHSHRPPPDRYGGLEVVEGAFTLRKGRIKHG